MDQECLQQMTDCMKGFLLQVKPIAVVLLEEHYQYNWINMRPFVDAVYSYGVEKVKLSDACLQKSRPSAAFTKGERTLPPVPASSLATSVSVAYLLFALKVETARTRNTELLVHQGLLECVTMLHWGLDPEWQTQCEWVQEQVKKVCGKFPVPRLSLIARAKLARSMKEYSGHIVA